MERRGWKVQGIMELQGTVNDDFTDDHWMILLEDSGPNGMGRVLGFFVFHSETEAYVYNVRGELCEALGLFVGEAIPEDVVTEVITYGDFKASYGNRMPLTKRGYLQ